MGRDIMELLTMLSRFSELDALWTKIYLFGSHIPLEKNYIPIPPIKPYPPLKQIYLMGWLYYWAHVPKLSSKWDKSAEEDVSVIDNH